MMVTKASPTNCVSKIAVSHDEKQFNLRNIQRQADRDSRNILVFSSQSQRCSVGGSTERGLVRITTVTRLETGYPLVVRRWRPVFTAAPVSAMPVEYMTPTIEDRAVQGPAGTGRQGPAPRAVDFRLADCRRCEVGGSPSCTWTRTSGPHRQHRHHHRPRSSQAPIDGPRVPAKHREADPCSRRQELFKSPQRFRHVPVRPMPIRKRSVGTSATAER